MARGFLPVSPRLYEIENQLLLGVSTRTDQKYYVRSFIGLLLHSSFPLSPLSNDQQAKLVISCNRPTPGSLKCTTLLDRRKGERQAPITFLVPYAGNAAAPYRLHK